MSRLSTLLACYLCAACSYPAPKANEPPTVHGDPASKASEPPTNKELTTIKESIVGVWEAVSLRGKAPEKLTIYNFAVDDKIVIASEGKIVATGRYTLQKMFDDPVIELIFEERCDPSGYHQIMSLTARELITHEILGNHENSVFKRE